MIYINGKSYTIEELRRGYAIITQLDNGAQMTDEEIIEYMKEALKE